MASHGVKVSSPNNDVLTQAAKDLQFHTEYNTLKLLQTGTIQITTNASGDATGSVTHGLGFAPAFFTFQKCTASWSFMDINTYPNAYVPDVGTVNYWGSNYHHTLHAYADSNNFYVQAKGAAPNTTYTIKYFLLMDLAQTYSGNVNITLDKHFGMKVSQPGFDVLTAKEYQMQYSQKYKALMYYDVNYKIYSLTLPEMWASPIDTPVEEGTYVDINHGLGFPPFFLAFFRSSINNNTISYAVPQAYYNAIDVISANIGGFCDATRVRLSFWRSSMFALEAPQPKFTTSETITLKCYIFTEDLSQSSL